MRPMVGTSLFFIAQRSVTPIIFHKQIMKKNALVLVLILCVGLSAQMFSSDAEKERKCTDPSGKLLYVVRGDQVRIPSGRLLGTIRNGEVRDVSGRLLAKGGDAGLLFCWAMK